MIQGKLWLLTVHSQFRLRLSGASAEELKAVANLPEITTAPLEWWANLGEKGQIVATPKFAIPPVLEGVIEDSSLKRYEAGMVLTIRREKNDRLAIQLPAEAFHLGAIPDVGAIAALYARPNSLEVWKADHWKEEAIKTASILSAHLARIGDDPA